MSAIEYTDRFGYTWSIRSQKARGARKDVTFVWGDIRLLVTEAEAIPSGDLTDSRVKELFCDAERILVHENEKWYIGYRTRAAGRGGRAQAGMCTRFRSETGEVRYSKEMLHFRHMPEGVLCKHLADARVGK